MHVEIPRVATYFSEQNKICPLGIFPYMGYFPDGILSSGILSSWGIFSSGIFSTGIFSSGILSSWDFFLHGILSSWDFIQIPHSHICRIPRPAHLCLLSSLVCLANDRQSQCLDARKQAALCLELLSHMPSPIVLPYKEFEASLYFSRLEIRYIRQLK